MQYSICKTGMVVFHVSHNTIWFHPLHNRKNQTRTQEQTVHCGGKGYWIYLSLRGNTRGQHANVQCNVQLWPTAHDMHHTFRCFYITFNLVFLLMHRHGSPGPLSISIHGITLWWQVGQLTRSSCKFCLSNSFLVLVILQLLLPKGTLGGSYSDSLMYTLSWFCVLNLRLWLCPAYLLERFLACSEVV